MKKSFFIGLFHAQVGKGYRLIFVKDRRAAFEEFYRLASAFYLRREEWRVEWERIQREPFSMTMLHQPTGFVGKVQEIIEAERVVN